MARQVPLRVYKKGRDKRLDARKDQKKVYHTTRNIEGVEEEGMIMPVSKIGDDTGIWLSEVPAFTQDRKYAFEIPLNALEDQKLEAGEKYRGEKSRDIGRWGKWYVYRDIIPLKDIVRVLYWTGGDPHKMPLNDVAEEVVLNEEEELTAKEMLKPAINLVQEYVQGYDVPPIAVTPGGERQVEDLAVDIDYRYTPLALYIKRQPEEYPPARGVIVINRPRLRCIADNVPEWETVLHLTLLHEFAHHLDQFQPSAIPLEPSQETLEYLDTHHTTEEATEEEIRMWDFAFTKLNLSVEEYVEIERKVVKALEDCYYKNDVGGVGPEEPEGREEEPEEGWAIGKKVEYMGREWRITDKEIPQYSDLIKYDIEEIGDPENTRGGIEEGGLEEI